MNNSDTSCTANHNPLLKRAVRIPFNVLRPDHVAPAIQALLEESRAELTALKAIQTHRTFANTMQALDDLGVNLDYAMGLVGHIEAVATTPEWRDAYSKALPLVTQFKSELLLDPTLWSALREYADTTEAKTLTDAAARFLRKTIVK